MDRTEISNLNNVSSSAVSGLIDKLSMCGQFIFDEKFLQLALFCDSDKDLILAIMNGQPTESSFKMFSGNTIQKALPDLYKKALTRTDIMTAETCYDSNYLGNGATLKVILKVTTKFEIPSIQVSFHFTQSEERVFQDGEPCDDYSWNRSAYILSGTFNIELL